MSVLDQAMAEMRALAKPCVRFKPTFGPSTTQLGGTPRVPKDFLWPEYKGKPQAFIAQIDLGALAELLGAERPAWFPERGSLAFFYDSEQRTWGFDPKNRGSWHVAWFEDAAALAPRECPASIPEHARHSFRPYTLVRAVSHPDEQRLTTNLTSLTDEEGEALHEFAQGGQQEGAMHQVLGFPAPVQSDGMELECQLASNGVYVGDAKGYEDPRVPVLTPGAADWRLLLQVDSDEGAGMMWGDCGMLYFWIREADAKARHFDNVWMILQCA